MERVVSVEKMRRAETAVIKSGVSETELISRAGKSLAEEIIKRFSGGKVFVVIGKGNNGKDGEKIAEELLDTGRFSVTRIYGLPFPEEKPDIIADCLFGIGLNREITGETKAIIEKINSSGAYVVSCDIPSGISADSGKALGTAVKADLTCAVQEYKTGHFLQDGIDFCGELIKKDVGITPFESAAFILEKSDVKGFFARPERNRHKGDFKKVAVIGGSKNYSGSAVLAALSLAAFKTGLSYVNIAVPECVFPAIAGISPECTVTLLSDDGNGVVFRPEEIKPLLSYDALCVGMGLKPTEETYKLVKFLLGNYCGKLVIDADGLNALSVFGKDILKNERKCKVVLTPHIGEFSRLSGESKESIISGGTETAKRFAKEFNVVLILKSATSIITDGTTVYINTTGSVAMAKAGSGDVLSGVVGGMVTKGEDTVLCAAAGAYLFGKAGEIAEKLHGNTFTVTATDLVSAIPYAVSEIIG